ncbi:hypothetical protein [Wolbachia endosymbiont (group B) of Myelois circumvoluta]|uniref:hypothetical protein n=1 Tax=Wolbachia endosymbiont (group B) of Myelois circumvoluta TaxID=3066180 RepID=UPI00376F06E7
MCLLSLRPSNSPLSYDNVVGRLQHFAFPPHCYPSYRTSTFILVGLPPTEHTCLLWTHNQSTQNKIINLAIGAVSILAGGLSLLITAKVGFIAICSTIAILALYEYIKDEKIGKDINDKFDEIANNTTEFCVNSIEKLIPSQSCEV